MSETHDQDPAEQPIEPAPAELEQLIDQALEEAPQLVLEGTIRLGQIEEIMAALAGPAARMALQMRLEQIVKHGHDREHDEMLPIMRLPQLAREQLSMALDTSLTAGDRRDLRVAKLRLARAAAMCLAGIDRINMINEEGN